MRSLQRSGDLVIGQLVAFTRLPDKSVLHNLDRYIARDSLWAKDGCRITIRFGVVNQVPASVVLIPSRNALRIHQEVRRTY